MLDLSFITGIIGSVLIVVGAAWGVEKVKHPIYSKKNWLFAIGGIVMLIYAVLNYYYHQAPFFYIIFELFIALTSVLMMADTDDRLDTVIVSIATALFIIWSLYLFEGYSTIIFIIGLSLTGLGYTLQMQSIRRNLALTIGSTTIAIFSFVVASWLFFFLNVFFAIFSSYYLLLSLKSKQSKKHKI